jgi:hypothetical protein
VSEAYLQMEGGWIDHAARSERNKGAIESCTDSASKAQSALEADRQKVPGRLSWPRLGSRSVRMEPNDTEGEYETREHSLVQKE